MPRYLISVLVLAAILVIVGTAGCIAQPTVVVDSVRIGSLTPANTTLQVLVRITNPNSFDIPLQNVSFTVYSVEASGTRRLGEGATGPFTLPGRQTIDQTVPVTLDNQALLEAALVAVRAGQERDDVPRRRDRERQRLRHRERERALHAGPDDHAPGAGRDGRDAGRRGQVRAGCSARPRPSWAA